VTTPEEGQPVTTPESEIEADFGVSFRSIRREAGALFDRLLAVLS
jgi:hypothetical protein